MNPAISSLPWYDDLCSCLQMDIGLVLERAGWEPVRALAAGWRFTAPTGPVESVEFYHPAGDRLETHLCLHHPVEFRWHHPVDAADAHRQLLDALERGVLPVVAVNNYHLPFRPAYHDVHAAHLLVVTGHRAATDGYLISDPMPPAFTGELPRPVLEAARGSLSIDDQSDPFFAGASPAFRWLEVGLTGPQPPLTPAWLRAVLHDNLAAQHADGGHGPAALSALLDTVLKRLREEGVGALQELYVLGWPAQAEAALHANFLADAARSLDWPDLAELGRWVDLVAHSWTGFRVAAAHAAIGDGSGEEQVLSLGRRLLATWELCLDRLESVLREDR
ncbi:BtrH N-terminal domain-containing protein [Streptomyces griseoincarnatus]